MSSYKRKKKDIPKNVVVMYLHPRGDLFFSKRTVYSGMT